MWIHRTAILKEGGVQLATVRNELETIGLSWNMVLKRGDLII